MKVLIVSANNVTHARHESTSIKASILIPTYCLKDDLMQQ